MPPPLPTHTLFIGVLGGLVQVFVPYCGTRLLRGVLNVPLVPVVPLVGRV